MNKIIIINRLITVRAAELCKAKQLERSCFLGHLYFVAFEPGQRDPERVVFSGHVRFRRFFEHWLAGQRGNPGGS